MSSALYLEKSQDVVAHAHKVSNILFSAKTRARAAFFPHFLSFVRFDEISSVSFSSSGFAVRL